VLEWVREDVGETVEVWETVRVGETDGVIVGVKVRVADEVRTNVGDFVDVVVIVAELDFVNVSDGVVVRLRDMLGLTLPVHVPESLLVTDEETDTVPVDVAVAETVPVSDVEGV
jgi:hypothetical protein